MTASSLEVQRRLHCFMRWMRIAIAGITALLALSVTAQTGKADLLVVGTASGAAGELGTLLLSPAQRRSLEAARNLGDKEDGVRALPSDSQLLVLPERLVVSGMVVRSGNRSTVWVNDQPLYGQAPVTPLRTLAGRAGVLQLQPQEMKLRAKPGQIIEMPSGQSLDLLPPGSIRIIPPKVGAGVINKEP